MSKFLVIIILLIGLNTRADLCGGVDCGVRQKCENINYDQASNGYSFADCLSNPSLYGINISSVTATAPAVPSYCMNDTSNITNYCSSSCGHASEDGCKGTNSPTASGGSKDAADATSAKIAQQRCDDAYKSAKAMCQGDQMANGVTNQVSAMNKATAAGDMSAACSRAQEIVAAGAAANVGFAYECKTKADKCIDACQGAQNPNGEDKTSLRMDKYASACDDFSNNYLSAMGQGAQQAMQYVSAGDCKKQVASACQGADAYSNMNCIQQCLSGQAPTSMANFCTTLAQQCTNPSFAKTNPSCTCVSNPTLPNCAGALPNLNAANTKKAFDPNALLDGMNGLAVDPYSGNNLPGSKSQAESQQNPGGGGGLGSGSGGSGFGSGGGGAGDPQAGINTNILGKQTGGGGGGFPGGSGGGGSNPFFGGKGGSGDSNSKGINLRDFLPGGKKDARAIASQTLAQQGITPSTGLTNFQKITRKLAEKRATLAP